MKRLQDTNAFLSIHAYVIIVNGRMIGKILSKNGESRLRAELILYYHPDYKNPHYQHCSASGYGYDKLSSALEDMTICGIKKGYKSLESWMEEISESTGQTWLIYEAI